MIRACFKGHGQTMCTNPEKIGPGLQTPADAMGDNDKQGKKQNGQRVLPKRKKTKRQSKIKRGMVENENNNNDHDHEETGSYNFDVSMQTRARRSAANSSWRPVLYYPVCSVEARGGGSNGTEITLSGAFLA